MITPSVAGLLDYFVSRPRPVYYPSSGGSRYGRPSILATGGQLGPATTSASLSVSPASHSVVAVSPWVVSRPPAPTGSRYRQHHTHQCII